MIRYHLRKGGLYVGVVSPLDKFPIVMFTVQRSNAIIHTSEELPAVNAVLKERGVKYTVDTIEGMGLEDTMT